MKDEFPSISELFPRAINVYIKKFFDDGFILTLVGGATRDYLLEKKLSKDIDFELRHKNKLKGLEFLNYVSSFIDKLDEGTNDLTKLPYGIFRLKFDEMELEFSIPRKEIFKGPENFGHKNFECEYSSEFDYHDSFKRRDFSINAIGMEYSDLISRPKLKDPYNGYRDLDNKKLNFCGDENFFQDPVRFARLIRFGVKYGFSTSKDILEKLSNFNLSELSFYYFQNEAMKSLNPFQFFNLFFDLVIEKNIVLNEKIMKFKFLSRIVGPNYDGKKDKYYICYSIIRDRKVNKDEIEIYADYSGIKKTFIKNLVKLRQLLGRHDIEESKTPKNLENEIKKIISNLEIQTPYLRSLLGLDFENQLMILNI